MVAGAAMGVLVSQALLVGGAAAQPAGSAPFNDLGSVPWAVHAIDAMHSRGVLEGTGPTTFSPDAPLTRAQMATALGRLEGWPRGDGTPTPAFTDWSTVPSWAKPYVATAAQHHVLKGEPGGAFAPNAGLKWDELAVIVARAFQYPPVPADQVPMLLAELAHGTQTPDWAQQAVAEDVQAGDFSGILADLYRPNRPVSRAELALFLDQAATGLETATAVSMNPTPVAAPASLAAGESVSVTVYAKNAIGHPAADTQVYLSLESAAGGGSAAVDGTALSATPAVFATGAGGTLTVRYTAPAVLPASGTDTLTAATANAGATARDSYSFSKAAPAITALSLKPSPIAPVGSLAAGKSVAVTVHAVYGSVYGSTYGQGRPAANATVYLTFDPTAGGGTATVNGTALGSTPQAFQTGAGGTLTVQYTTPGTLPDGGTDTLTAADAATGAKVTARDSYSFSTTTTTASGAFAGVTITLQEADGQTVTYPLAPGVTVTKNGQTASLADLGPGETVTVIWNAQGQVTRIQIGSTS